MKRGNGYMKKYYLRKTWDIYVMLFISPIFIAVNIMDIVDETSSGLFLISSWLVLLIFSFIFLGAIFVLMTKKLKISYLEISEENIVLRNGLGKIKTASYTCRFEYKVRKDKLKWIISFDENNKPTLIIGNGFDISLEEVKNIIESKQIDLEL